MNAWTWFMTRTETQTVLSLSLPLFLLLPLSFFFPLSSSFSLSFSCTLSLSLSLALSLSHFWCCWWWCIAVIALLLNRWINFSNIFGQLFYGAQSYPPNKRIATAFFNDDDNDINSNNILSALFWLKWSLSISRWQLTGNPWTITTAGYTRIYIHIGLGDNKLYKYHRLSAFFSPFLSFCVHRKSHEQFTLGIRRLQGLSCSSWWLLHGAGAVLASTVGDQDLWPWSVKSTNWCAKVTVTSME